jgi:hypothetical protein
MLKNSDVAESRRVVAGFKNLETKRLTSTVLDKLQVVLEAA